MKKTFFHLAEAVQTFWENYLVKWLFLAGRMSGIFQFDFSHFFQFQTIYFCSKISSTWKMLSFEVHDVDVAQKMTDWEGRSKATIAAYGPPPNSLIFEVGQHDISQKIAFFM